MAWDPEDPIQKQKRVAWSVATSTCVQTREDPVMIYNRIMKEYEQLQNKYGETLSDASWTVAALQAVCLTRDQEVEGDLNPHWVPVVLAASTWAIDQVTPRFELPKRGLGGINDGPSVTNLKDWTEAWALSLSI